MERFPTPSNNQRIGFHYFPDDQHYRLADLQAWLPELKALGTQWLTLQAPLERAIPEPFIRGLADAGIEPILHFKVPLDDPPTANDLSMLFSRYKDWGIHYVTLFDRPNLHKFWGSPSWIQHELVERFLDIFIPVAEEACRNNLFPVFPPLEPGGDYWDTIFIRSALQSLKRRGNSNLLDKIVLGAYAWAGNLPFNWGAGGPESWPGTRPYFTPPDEQDHKSLRIFDWYNSAAKAALDHELPILLLACGSRPGDLISAKYPPVDETDHAERNLHIARLLAGEADVLPDGAIHMPIPENVLAGCFWVFSAASDSPFNRDAWFKGDGVTLPAVQMVQAWLAERKEDLPAPKSLPAEPEETTAERNTSLIKHYLLLPSKGSDAAHYCLKALQAYINQHRPTMGFSIDEAVLAEKITILEDTFAYPNEVIEKLQGMDCTILHTQKNGTSIAT
jgi:hypothetical protein